MTGDSGTICPRCGSLAAVRLEGSCAVAECPKCGWAVATTYIPEIETDFTKYELKLILGDKHNVQQCKAISRITGLNLLQARSLLDKPGTLILCGRAVEVAEAKKQLNQVGVAFEILPAFNY